MSVTASVGVILPKRIAAAWLRSALAPCAALARGSGRRGESFRKLHVDRGDAIGVPIREPAQECAEQLPLAAGLARADDFAADHSVADRPVHPAVIGLAHVLDPLAAAGGDESAQFLAAHRV